MAEAFHPALLAALTLGSAFGIGYTANVELANRAWSMVPGSGMHHQKAIFSLNTGERIYHVPGQHYYHDTVYFPQAWRALVLQVRRRPARPAGDGRGSK